MRMAHVGRKGQHVSADIVSSFGAGFERPTGVAVTKIVNTRLASSSARAQADSFQKTAKYPAHRKAAESTALVRDEQTFMFRGETSTTTDITLDASRG